MKFFVILPIIFLPLVFVAGNKLSKKETVSEVAAINKILGSTYKKHDVKVPAKLDDALLARRLYLKAAGRIPTHEELSSYLGNSSKDKKNQLINQLVESSAFDSQMFNWWADLLRLQTRMRGGNQIGAGQLYVHWVKEQVQNNVPFDEMAFNLITAEGYPWENGAVGYYLRDAGMPLDNMSNTTQIFLGTQMVCAQCHNHPFDRWTQMEYYQMASYTYGVNSSKGGDIQSKIKSILKNKPKGFPQKINKRKHNLKKDRLYDDPFRKCFVLSDTVLLIRIVNLPCPMTISMMMESPNHWFPHPQSLIILFRKKKVNLKSMRTVNG